MTITLGEVLGEGGAQEGIIGRQHLERWSELLERNGMTSTTTAAQCRVLWMRCVERSEPVKLGCAGEERGQLGDRAVLESCALNSGINVRRGMCVCVVTDVELHKCPTHTTSSPFISSGHAKTHTVSMTYILYPNVVDNILYTCSDGHCTSESLLMITCSNCSYPDSDHVMCSSHGSRKQVHSARPSQANITKRKSCLGVDRREEKQS